MLRRTDHGDAAAAIALFEEARQMRRTLIAAELFIKAKHKKYGATRQPLARHKAFKRGECAYKQVRAVCGAAAPHRLGVEINVPGKGRIQPLVDGAWFNGHDILVRCQHEWFECRLGAWHCVHQAVPVHKFAAHARKGTVHPGEGAHEPVSELAHALPRSVVLIGIRRVVPYGRVELNCTAKALYSLTNRRALNRIALQRHGRIVRRLLRTERR